MTSRLKKLLIACHPDRHGGDLNISLLLNGLFFSGVILFIVFFRGNKVA
jgi:hypothetical protein